MAVATSSSRTGLVKAVVLPWVLVLLLAVAAGASGTEDGAAVAKSGGRFPETPGGRKLLGNSSVICGAGSAPDYNCKNIILGAKNATCCTDTNGNQSCVEVGGVDVFNCGACFNKCKAGDICCSGVCLDPTKVDNTSLQADSWEDGE